MASGRLRGPDQHGHEALPRPRRTALFGADLDIQIEEVHQPADGRRVELAERLLGAVADLAEDRAADVDGAAPLAPLHDGAAAPVCRANHPARDTHHEMDADARWRRTNDGAFEGRQFGHAPFRG